MVDPKKRLRWRARRGLLENDLILTRFLDAYEATMTNEEAEAFIHLMELPDHDLIDILLQRQALTAAVDLPQLRALLQKLQCI